MSAVVIVEEGESMALVLEMEKLKKEWEEKMARSVEVAKALEDLKLHKLRMKRLTEELSVAEAWEIELEARRKRIEESLKPPLLGLFDKLEKEEFVGNQLLQEAFASGGEDTYVQNPGEQGKKSDAVGEKGSVDVCRPAPETEAHDERGYWAGQGGEAGQGNGAGAGQA